MPNRRDFILEQVRNGDAVFISACSQCASKATITFNGLDKAIVLKKTNSSCNLQRLEGEYSAIKRGVPLSFSIDIFDQDGIDEKNKVMKVTQHITVLTDKDGKEQGVCYVYNIEDVANGDEDFNDYYINVVAWHRKN